MAQIRPGVLIAVLTLVGFVVYAFFAPATYRSSALLSVEPIASGAPVVIPEPLEAARRLREAMLDRSMLERLARERASSSSPEAQAKAASQVRDALAIDTSDARTFSVSYSDSNAARAQRVCDQLAQHGVAQAPAALGTADQERAAQLKRQRQTQELAAFLTLHPEVASAPANDGRPDKIDPALSALRAEKTLVERRLAEGSAQDNPYADPADTNPEQLKRRLIELDSAITVRKKSLESQAVAQKLSPELAAEWRRLVAAVANVDDDAPTAPRLSARLLGPASKSAWPVEPNRPLLLFFGVVFGVGLGSAYTLVTRAAQRRRSSRPPPGDATRVTVPKAPGLPRGLGTAPTVRASAFELGATMPLPRPAMSSVPPPPALNPAAPQTRSIPPPLPQSQPPPAAPSEPPPVAPSEPPLNPARSHSGSFSAEVSERDPVLAAAAQAWDQAVRTNNVPGFAVVGPSGARPHESAPPPATLSAPPPRGPRASARSGHKVTQPLGSFLPGALEGAGLATRPSPPPAVEQPQPSPGEYREYPPRSPAPARPQPSPGEYREYPPRSPAPARPQPSAGEYREYPPRSPLPAKSPSGATRYSYVSSAPPPPLPQSDKIHVQLARADWAPEPSLSPAAQRALCERFYPLAVERCFTLTVVSVPECHDQKSRVAAEIALSLAESGHPRVLLVEGDFYRPQVHRLLRMEMPIGAGFSQQLHSRIHGAAPALWTVLGCTSSLHAIGEGMMRSPGLLLSHQFGDAMNDFRGYYDFVVIDGPTASLDVDAHAAVAVSDGVVIVRPAGNSPSLPRVESLFDGKLVSYAVV